MRMSMILVKNKQILTLAVVMAIADSIALTNNRDCNKLCVNRIDELFLLD